MSSSGSWFYDGEVCNHKEPTEQVWEVPATVEYAVKKAESRWMTFKSLEKPLSILLMLGESLRVVPCV